VEKREKSVLSGIVSEMSRPFSLEPLEKGRRAKGKERRNKLGTLSGASSSRSRRRRRRKRIKRRRRRRRRRRRTGKKGKTRAAGGEFKK
jgi:hypothetical protein